jgi:hypothetical protein
MPKGTGSIPDEAIEFFAISLILLATLGPGVNSASNINGHQKIFRWNRALLARKADKFSGISEPIVAMWDPQHLTLLWASRPVKGQLYFTCIIIKHCVI